MSDFTYSSSHESILSASEIKSKCVVNETELAQSPPTPKKLVWRELVAQVVPQRSWYSILKKKQEPKMVLNHVYGVAQPGEVTILMGSSGAGKTTLLNILTQRVRGMQVVGDILVNKNPIESHHMRRISAYVQQENIFLGELTVFETLMFAARLKLPDTMSGEEKKRRVDRVATEMGLKKCLDTKIGSNHEKSISTGEKKRLSFACEVLTNPSILFCDEPTSGLDAYMALQVMRALVTLAKEGKTIVCCIHQPSSLVFELADRLVLLATGRIVYQGAIERTERFFSSAGYACPQYISIPDHFMRVVSKGEEPDHVYKKRIDSLIQAYEKSEEHESVMSQIHENTTSSRRVIGEEQPANEYAVRWHYQCYYLFCRGCTCVIRNPMVLKVRLFQCLLVSFIIGIVYFQMEIRRDTIMNFKGIGFNALRDMNMMFMFPCLQVFTSELPVVYKEYKSAMYSPSAYFMGKNMADTLQYFVLPAVYSVVVYWMAGLSHSVVQYLWFWIISTFMATTATSVGYAAACIFGDLTLASSILPLFTIPMLAFGGFFVDLRTVKWYLKPLSYLSWYKYAFEAHMINIFTYIDDIPDCMNTTTPCEGSTGLEVLENAGFDQNYFFINMTILVLFFVSWRTLALVALRIRVRNH